ncbi:MAG: hypothetical protein M1814_003238 [Vezdaea aestivalis]|nr:MAG: hypothetical protein M1814_003238 [Vezdaea aestivalis]
MLFKKSIAAVAAVVGAASAQNASSLCDKYTLAVLNTSTAATQGALLTVLVNTAVIGNYSKYGKAGVRVPGILANGTTMNGTKVNLLPYFNGGLASSNRGGSAGVAVNFLDDGGAVPLMMDKPANGTSSNQYKLLTHLYEYFGMLLGCSAQSNSTTFKQYSGAASQYQVHKFMGLGPDELQYFIEQVGLAAVSLGVTVEDATAVGKTLAGAFNVRCAPPVALIPYQGAQLQAMCSKDSCPLAMNSVCPAEKFPTPGVANSTLAMGLGNASSTATASAAGGGSSSASATRAGGAASTTTSGIAAMNTMGSVAAVVGAAALAFAL